MRRPRTTRVDKFDQPSPIGGIQAGRRRLGVDALHHVPHLQRIDAVVALHEERPAVEHVPHRQVRVKTDMLAKWGNRSFKGGDELLPNRPASYTNTSALPGDLSLCTTRASAANSPPIVP